MVSGRCFGSESSAATRTEKNLPHHRLKAEAEVGSRGMHDRPTWQQDRVRRDGSTRKISSASGILRSSKRPTREVLVIESIVRKEG